MVCAAIHGDEKAKKNQKIVDKDKFFDYNIKQTLEVFMKGKIYSVLVLVFGIIAFSCDNGTANGKIYSVTIGTLPYANGCTITANPTSGTEGTEITLTVNELTGFQLKAGTLKYGTTAINETTKKFNLPASDVTITAEFESALAPAQRILGTWLCDDFEQDRWFKFVAGGTGQFANDGNFTNAVNFTYTYNGTLLTITNSSGPGAIPNGDYPLIIANDNLSFAVSGDGQNQIYDNQS
jgi:hypothetical protein